MAQPFLTVFLGFLVIPTTDELEGAPSIASLPFANGGLVRLSVSNLLVLASPVPRNFLQSFVFNPPELSAVA